MPSSQSLIINGWTIYTHPIFLLQVQDLINQVEQLKRKHPETYHKKNATKRLAAIAKLVFEVIPSDPTSTEYRQGETMGKSYKHWFRAKFFQQYRLFFRYHQEGKIIVFAWVNDEKTKRAYGSKFDAYRVFQKMLDNGNPPDSWKTLLSEAQQEDKGLKALITQMEKFA